MDPQSTDRLQRENAALRDRIEQAEREIAVLRAEAIARRAEVRELAASLPSAVSRRAVLTSIARDALSQPRRVGRALTRRRRPR